ncbi:LysR family transcriptional regulator [Fodinisporobacter ferrooxydans]|uniref:LysR family transcriptional regulator n=1 Tax=Fodinisporobacter ferrooxydans TaxID=2901836 RepID=A0ABY4CND4_9BACL|nr:LysR family transcriptional regulator [Alicyclobacillaceae bacterium MYW30-H2]
MDRLLLTFVTVAEKRSFTRAAEELHLTQSAVSREIEALEAEYETKLFDRTNKSVRLTRAGEILYYHGKNIVSEYYTAYRIISDLTGTAVGNLAIGSGYTFGEYLLPHAVAKFKSLYPLITPKITIMNSKRIGIQVLQHEVDLGIVDGKIELKGVTTQPFAQDEMMIVAPRGHWLSRLDEVNIRDLVDETWILRESGSGTRSVIDRVFRDLGFSPISVMEFGSNQIIKESVQAGLGISIISKWVFQKEVNFNLLHALRIKDYTISRDFFCVTHTSKFRTKALELFLDFLQLWARELDLNEKGM